MKTAVWRSLMVSAAFFVFYSLRLQLRSDSQPGARLVMVAVFTAMGFLLSSGVILARPKVDWDWLKIFALNIALTILVAGLTVLSNPSLPAWLRAL